VLALVRGLNARRRLLQGVLAQWLRPPAARVDDPAVRRQGIQLGDTRVELAVHGAPGSALVFVNVHENEDTSVQVARALLQGRDDRLVELRSRGHRTVLFWIGRRPHLVDPNRIFSDEGLAESLRDHASWSPHAMAAVATLRAAIVAELASAELIVALHNNVGRGYSVRSYLAGGPYAAEADAVAVDARADPGDFFLVTQPHAFEALRGVGFGVVLQHPQARNDGSMSVRFQEARPLYVNVEARYGHAAQQRRMLELLLERIAVPLTSDRRTAASRR
jgi:hypothetical protein